MFDHLTEMMLRSYFIAENTVGRFYGDKQALFSAYAKIFLVPSDEAARLFALASREEVTGILSEREYHQHLRLKQFLAMNARSRVSDAELEDMIDLKGTAFTMALNYQLMQDAKEVKSVACENLALAAESGIITALNVLGILQMEGIVLGKDRENGLRKIQNAADWDSEEGLLAALYYDAEGREKYLERLHDCMVRIGHGMAFERVRAVYGDYTEGKHGEYKLLEKAFRQGLLKREVYNKPYARLVYSKLLNDRDKEALVLSPNKELFAEACSLPLKLGSTSASFNAEALADLRPDRVEERTKVICGLGNTDLCAVPSYRPLCFVSGSKYMLNFYETLIPRCFRGCHTERIEVSDLAEYDFEPTKNNIFVRSCDEDAFNLYLLSFRGEISDRYFDMVKNFLQSGKRGKFRLNHPSVSLDLSAVLPVCFADSENAKKLRPYCDIIRITELTVSEKVNFLEHILEEKAQTYGIGKLTVRAEVAEKLTEYGIDDIERVCDAAICEHRTHELTLTEEIVRPYLRGIGARRTYGFGGSIHDDHE